MAAIIVVDDGSVLLHRRSRTGGWAPPSGGVEPGESLSAALHREVREETRLVIGRARAIGIYSEPDEQIVTYKDGRRVHYVTTVFLCQVAGGQFRGSAEGTEWGWFSKDSPPEPLLPYAARWLQDARKAGISVR